MNNKKKSYYLFNQNHYEIGSPKSLNKFFSNVLILFPNKTYICFEGGLYLTDWEEIRNYIQSQLVTESKPGIDTYDYNWQCIPLNFENMEKMKYFSNNYSALEITQHICIYYKNEVVLQWFDVPDDPIYVASSISLDLIKKFCQSINSKFEAQLMQIDTE